MRILHTADLHLGKNVNGFSMIQEQEETLLQIIDYVKEYNVDTLLIAGDVYDKRNPSDESVALFNEFISQVSLLKIPVLIISGNHDSGVKLQFGKEIMKHQNIHISGVYEGHIEKIVLDDDYGSINFYLMPFIRPGDVRKYHEVTSYHDALETVIKEEAIDYSQRNVFVGHQFFASGSQEMSDSEIIAVGGIDNVGYSILEDFDYAALGHLHKPQKLIHETIRYSGSIVTYSESEVNDKKGVVLFELKEKGTLTLERLPLVTKKKFRKIKTYMKDLEAMPASEDYVFVTLLDDDIVDALNKVRAKFPNVMSLDFDNERTRSQAKLDVIDVQDIPVDTLFYEFFKLQNNQELTESQKEIVADILERIDPHASN